MKKPTKNTSDLMEELILQVRQNVERDREFLDTVIQTVVDEATSSNSTQAMSRASKNIKELMDVKVKSNDLLVKLATSVQRKEQHELNMKHETEAEEELDPQEFLETLYEGMK